MKGLFWGIFAIFTLSIWGVPQMTEAQDTAIRLMIDGKIIQTDVPPLLVENRTMVPVRVITEGLGATVTWNEATNQVTVTDGDKSVVLTIGKADAMVNGKPVHLDTPALIQNNRTFVPLRFIGDALNTAVGWQAQTNTVIVNRPYSMILNGLTLHSQDKVFRMADDIYLPLQALVKPFNLLLTQGDQKGKVAVSADGQSWLWDTSATPAGLGPVSIDDQIYVPVSLLPTKLGVKTKVDHDRQKVLVYQYITPEKYHATPLPDVMKGTFLFVWKAEHIDNGDINAMISQAKQLGINGVMIKFADGSLNGDVNSQKYMDQFKRLAGPFKAAGFKVGGWIYQYFTDVPGEVDAVSQAVQAGADFIVLDGEEDLVGKNKEAAQFGQELRAKYPNLILGLSSYAFANLHSGVPFDEYNQFVNVMMPQVYWTDMQWKVEDAFNLSLATYNHYHKPIVVTGQLYGQTAPDDIHKFIQLSQNYKLEGTSWWDWDEATADQLQQVGTGTGPIVTAAH
jgi:hypothetical protein